MPARPLRSGIVGTGFIGEIHARAVRAAGGIVGGVAAATHEMAVEGAAKVGASWAAESPAELIESDDIDVVHVCTPNAHHLAFAELALKVGKPVICEKPLALSGDDAQHLVDLAAANDVVTGVPFVYRFYPSVREARARISSGEAGKLRLVHGSYLQDWLSSSTDGNWRIDPSIGGPSRAFADIGVHWCDLMEFTTGHRIDRLSARLVTAFAQRGAEKLFDVTTEDAATVIFETDRGAIGSVVVTALAVLFGVTSCQQARRDHSRLRIESSLEQVDELVRLVNHQLLLEKLENGSPDSRKLERYAMLAQSRA